MTVHTFRKTALRYWSDHGRHNLPWRHTDNPYHIVVSEIMLQQTQVKRVETKYHEFLARFPTLSTLADVPLSEVLRIWVGLGYNRRAKYLHEAARMMVARHGAAVPRLRSELEALPGIGQYTAGAVRVFAYNEPDVFIETNIRAALIHHFFFDRNDVSDSELVPLLKKLLPKDHPRQWYWALMDYGSYLKATTPNPSRKSKHHTTQSKFEGSLRQVRGAIVRALTHDESLLSVQKQYSDRYTQAIESLLRDKTITKEGRIYRIS